MFRFVYDLLFFYVGFVLEIRKFIVVVEDFNFVGIVVFFNGSGNNGFVFDGVYGVG